MKKRRIFAACAALAAGLTILAAPIAAQQPRANTGEKIWLKALVMHTDSHTIIVREQADARMIHTFTYAPAVQEKMLKIMAHGGFRYGDKVKILYQQGQTVALEIDGKPSKPH